MNWKEIKESIDKQLSEKGVSDETPVWYIDYVDGGPDKVYVYIYEENGKIGVDC